MRMTPKQIDAACDAIADAAALIRAQAERVLVLEEALGYVRDAANFYDKVCASSNDEKIAVGRDHWDWLIDAANRARAALNATGAA